MKRGALRWRLAALGLAALGGTCGASAADAPFLWQVHTAKATHYLLGSVHVQPQSDAALPPALDYAYAHVRGLVFETDIDALETPDTQAVIIERGQADAGGLQAEVGNDLYARTRGKLQGTGLDPSFCDEWRAWMCAVTLEALEWNREGFGSAYGIDKLLYARAKTDARLIQWFEPPSQQLAMLYDMPAGMSRQFLSSAIEDDSADGESPAALYDAWRRNDIAAIEKLAAEMHNRYPAIYERLLAARNRAWMPKLRQLLAASDPQLIVAGAAHWPGPDGLLAQLRADGYSITPVPAAP